MGLNPHLINLMSLRERQRVESLATTSHPVARGDRSFMEALEESLAAAQESDGDNLTETQRLAALDAGRRFPQLTETARKSLTTAEMVNPQRLQQRYVGEFLQEHDLVLAAQRMPNSRYRTNPDDDTSGEIETTANVRPIR